MHWHCAYASIGHEAAEFDLEAWQAEIQQLFENEIEIHFAAEEKHLFPTAKAVPDLQPLVNELLAQHAELRHAFLASSQPQPERLGLANFGEKLVMHIRKEERQLFEGMQRVAPVPRTLPP